MNRDLSATGLSRLRIYYIHTKCYYYHHHHHHLLNHRQTDNHREWWLLVGDVPTWQHCEAVSWRM